MLRAEITRISAPLWRHNVIVLPNSSFGKGYERSSIYFDPQLHAVLRLKAAHTYRPVSDIVNEAVRAALADDQEDLKAFEDRVAESAMSYEALLDDLKAHGKL